MSSIIFSMNGFRKNLTNDLTTLYRTLDSVLDKLDSDDAEDIKNAFNQVARDSNFINCSFITDEPNFVDMTDEPTAPIFCEGDE